MSANAGDCFQKKLLLIFSLKRHQATFLLCVTQICHKWYAAS